MSNAFKTSSTIATYELNGSDGGITGKDLQDITNFTNWLGMTILPILIDILNETIPCEAERKNHHCGCCPISAVDVRYRS